MALLQGKVSSSCVSTYEYDTATQLLILTFRKPPIGPYYYYNVPQALFHSFKNAGSLGEFFNYVIRGRYE